MTSAQVVETSVTNNSSFQNYTHPDDHTIRTNVLFVIQKYWWRRFWWVFEDFRKFSKIVPKARRTLPKTFEGDPKMFRWYTNESKYNLRDKREISEIIDIFICEDIISSCVRISYRFYQFLTTRYTTDFYIIRIIPYILHVISLLREDVNSTNWPCS